MHVFTRPCVVLALLLCSVPLLAQTVKPVPPVIYFSGRLTQADGKPIADHTYSIRFSLWDAVSGGVTPKWEKTVSIIVKGGNYGVLMDGFTDAMFTDNLWLEIQIGSDPALPRQQVGSVAYAFKANTVPDGAITSDKIADGAVTAKKLDKAYSTAGGDLTGTYPSPFLATLATSLAKVSGGYMFSSGGKIGVNTKSPQSRLHVNGNGRSFLLEGTDSAFMSFYPNTYKKGQKGLFGFATAGTTDLSISNMASGDILLGAEHIVVNSDLNINGRMRMVLPNGGGQLAVASNIGDNMVYLEGFHSDGVSAASGFVITGGGNNLPQFTVQAANSRFQGSLMVDGGVIQRGGAPLTLNGITDMGLYQQVPGWMRFVTTGSPFQWYSDSGIGMKPAMTLNPDGTLLLSGTLTVHGTDIQLSGRGGGDGNNGGAGRALVDGGAGGGLVVNYGNDFGRVLIQGDTTIGGTVTANAVEVSGSDVAEPYNISPAKNQSPVPGMVVVINPAPRKNGEMLISSRAYDQTVGGIISGAGGIKPGLILRQPGTVADGKYPIASAGRVWCYCDASAGGAIKPGDMLTTSNTPGHAMKAKDYAKSRGAVIGKAMSTLKSGKGLVLVLVMPQ